MTRRFRATPYVFLLPALALLGVFVVYPIVAVIYYSFTEFDIVRPHPQTLHPLIEGWIQRDVAVELFRAAGLDFDAEKARARKLSLDDMQGGSFTISNLGSLGGGAFAPIVNWPEVAILGVARAKMEPVWADGAFVPRLMMPLSLSYDHRVVDGADAVRFLRWVVEALEQYFAGTLKQAPAGAKRA